MTDWPALRAARSHHPALRMPFVIDGRKVGSVSRALAPRLRAWTGPLQVTERTVTLHAPAPERDAVLGDINATLHAEGLIRGWRGELFDLPDPATGAPLAHMERAAARFWGTLTRGAHANGYVADAAGRPGRLWIAQRARDKATDPGLFDNLVGGGVPSRQTPLQTLQREAWEEAGLQAHEVQSPAAGRVLRLLRDVPEGLQFEDLYAYDLALPAGREPSNQDGEVQGFCCLQLEEALALAAGEQMTVDAALTTLDFALRHRLLPPDETRRLAPLLEALFAPAHLGHQTP
jgi:8-oxo-dGTP pyrophosphatase MutT (NUDIX family)